MKPAPSAMMNQFPDLRTKSLLSGTSSLSLLSLEICLRPPPGTHDYFASL